MKYQINYSTIYSFHKINLRKSVGEEQQNFQTTPFVAYLLILTKKDMLQYTEITDSGQ